MTTKQVHTDIGFTRCAVCKIDLKGRFVYIDDRIEKLFGCTKEELFGKSLLDFLDERSQELFTGLLQQRNHYETFYDTTALTLTLPDGASVCVRVIVSLNFIAGNPVNFQLVLDETDRVEVVAYPSDSSEGYREFLDEVLNGETEFEWNRYLKMLCQFADAQQACVYMIGDDGLEPRSSTTDEDSAEYAFKSLPEPDELHKHVARSCQEYSFIDQSAVQKCIERFGSAPNEFIARLDFDEGGSYLIRLIFSDDFDHRKAQKSIEDARLALSLLKRTTNPEPVGAGERDISFDVKFTIGFLDSLGIAAFLSDADGGLIGYNPALRQYFDAKELEGSYFDLIKRLRQFNSPDFERKIVDYVAGPSPDESSQAELSIDIKLSERDSGRLTVMKLADSSQDLSACFVIVPHLTGTDSKSSSQNEYKEWLPVLAHARRKLRHAADLSLRLSDDIKDSSHGKGSDTASRIGDTVSELSAVATGVSQYMRLARSREREHVVDLNVLVDQALKNLLSDKPKLAITCKHKDLPKIKTRRRVLAAVLHHLIDDCVRYHSTSPVELTVEAIIADSRCNLKITDVNVDEVGNCSAGKDDVPDAESRKGTRIPPGQGIGFVISRNLVKYLRGEIQVSSSEGEGVCVTVSLPVD